MTPYTGQLIENRIFVHNIDESRRLFGEGYYGKPLGISKPKNSEFDVPLVLDLIEGYYLNLKKKLIVIKKGNENVNPEEILKVCKRQYINFEAKYNVFENLRENGYIVTPGIKFGCDFAVYIHGPGIDHAPFLVKVILQKENLTSIDIVLAGRLATTVKKQFILAVVDHKKNPIKFIGFDWWRA